MAYNRYYKHFTSSQELATGWVSGQDYIVNQLVLYEEKLYRCASDHTSVAPFPGVGTFWVGINPGDVVGIADGGTGETTQTAAFDALAPTTTAGDIIVHNGTDNVRQAIGSDGQVLVVDNAQTNKLKWATIQQGSKNYIPNATFENGVTPPSSWSTFRTTIDTTTRVPIGTIDSTDTTFTLAVSSSTPLAGTYSMTASTIGTTAITTAGYGFITAPFTIDAQDKAKPMGFSFYYQAISGSMNFSGTSSNTFAVYIYAVDGTSGWIQPAGVYNLVQSSGAGICSGTFQTTSDSTQYRLAIIMINSVSGSLSMRFDDFQLGPQTTVQGAAVSDWVSYTPTFNSGFTVGTSASGIDPINSWQWRRAGDSVEIQGLFKFGGAGSSMGSGIFTFSLPSGMSLDATKFPAPYSKVGSCTAYDTGGGTNQSVYTVVQLGASLTTFFIEGRRDDGIPSQWSATYPFTWGAGDEGAFYSIKIPISGWSSNTVMSNSTDTRVVAARITKNSAQAGVATNTQITFDNPTKDTHSAWDVSGSYYQVPVSGWYDITANAYASGATAGAGLFAWSIDSGVTKYYFGGTALTADRLSATTTAYFLAGQQIKLYWAGATVTINSGDTNTSVSFVMRSGPATIAASETVAASYGTVAATTLTGGANTLIPFAIKNFDTHSAFSGSTYTVPVSGLYRYTLSAYSGGTTGTTADFQLNLYKNGSVTKGGNFPKSGTAGTPLAGVMSVTVRCNAGDTLQAYIYNGTGTLNLLNNDTYNWFCVERIGN